MVCINKSGISKPAQKFNISCGDVSVMLFQCQKDVVDVMQQIRASITFYLQCLYARLIWAVAQVHIPPSGIWADSFFSNFQWVLNKKYLKVQVEEELVPWLLWRLWKNINEFIFRGKGYSAPAQWRRSGMM